MKTSLYSILCIVIRLGAVQLFVQTVMGLPYLWGAAQGADVAAGGQAALIGLCIAAIALSLLLWLYPGVLASLAASRASLESFESPIAAADLQYIALAVLGIGFAVQGLTDVVYEVLRLAVVTQMTEDLSFKLLLQRQGIDLLSHLLKVALGLSLAFGARGLTGLLRRLRERGLPAAWPEEKAEASRETRPASE